MNAIECFIIVWWSLVGLFCFLTIPITLIKTEKHAGLLIIISGPIIWLAVFLDIIKNIWIKIKEKSEDEC